MASSMDFKDLFERYQRVGAKNGISIVNYCKINGLRRVKYIADVLRKLISGDTYGLCGTSANEYCKVT